MSKITDYLNEKYQSQDLHFTGEEIVTIPSFQDAYKAIDNNTGEVVWLVADEDNSFFVSDIAAYKNKVSSNFVPTMPNYIF